MSIRIMQKNLPVLLVAIMLASFTGAVSAQQAMNMDELLRAVERGRVQDNQENKARESRFRSAKAEQDRLLREAEAEKKAEEQRSERLETEAEENKAELLALEIQLNERLGSLKELFGVMQ
jgi:biopolymer transport protein ExbB